MGPGIPKKIPSRSCWCFSWTVCTRMWIANHPKPSTAPCSRNQWRLGLRSVEVGFLPWWVSPTNHGVFNYLKMDVSANRHTPKSSILIGFSIINHPFWGTPIFGNTQNDHFGVWNGGTTIWGNTHILGKLCSLKLTLPMNIGLYQQEHVIFQPSNSGCYLSVTGRAKNWHNHVLAKIIFWARGWWQDHHTLLLMSSKKLQG